MRRRTGEEEEEEADTELKTKTSHVNVGKNLERVMEEEREWKDKIKGTDWSFGGCTITRAWLGRALWGVGRQCGVRLF